MLAGLGLCHCSATTVLNRTFEHSALLRKGLDQFDFLSPCTQAAEHAVNSQHCQARNFHSTRQTAAGFPVDTQPWSTLHQRKGPLVRLRVSGEFPQIHELSSSSLKRQTPDALALGRPIILKIIGHLMVHQSITVCRDVRQKPVHSVEQKGFRIFGWSLPAPCNVPQEEKTRWEAKTMPVSRVERGWTSSFQSMLRLRISNVCQIFVSSHHSALHTTHIPFNCHPSCPLRETADSLQQVAPVYLQSRKPEVPSGPVGWRITWLFGRTGSDGCCALIRAGLMIRGEIRINYVTVFFTSRYFPLHLNCSVNSLLFFLVCCNVLPVLAWIVLRRVIWRSTAQNPSSGFCILRLPLGQRLHLLRGTSGGCKVSCGTVIWRTFQNSNLWWGRCRQRVILDYNGSSNRWATRTQAGFPVKTCKE